MKNTKKMQFICIYEKKAVLLWRKMRMNQVDKQFNTN